MKRSLQEVVELVVFGLIALLIGTGVLWLGGWVLGWVGLLLKFLAGLIWWLLRFIVPVAIVAGLIYFLVRVLQGDRSSRPATPAPASAPGPTPAAPPAADPAPPAAASTTAPEPPSEAPSASSEDPSDTPDEPEGAHEPDSEDDDKRN
jgi:hypothetical protein